VWHDAAAVRIEGTNFASQGVLLEGTIASPDTPGPHRGLVLIGGSGPCDRHNDGFFDALSEQLVAAGLITLTYDKRGVGKSTGRWETATVDELAADAGAALSTLQAHPHAAADAVGVLGHSEGGWVALRLCAQRPTVAHVIMHSCPGTSFHESEVFALVSAGASPESAERVGVMLGELARASTAGADLAHAQALLAEVRAEPWFAPVRASGFDIDATAWSQLHVWGEYDPADDLSRLTVPTLVVLGAEDPLTPVEKSVARYTDTAGVAGRLQEIFVLPGGDHRLQRSTGGFVPGYTDRLIEWTRRRQADLPMP
jgi:pimeloyl-ACP methyl ester carboxylesterase